MASLATSIEIPKLAGVPNFWKVNEGVYRGGQPTTEGFKSLAGLGVKTVINLRRISEHSQSDEENAVRANGMRYVSVPMKGLAAPTNEQIYKILAILGNAAAAPVFIHCKRGADRTGTVIACYRISHDSWENRKALSEARSLGMRWFERAMQRFVLRFSPAQIGLNSAQFD
ncbi:MAG: tyrosine-protein phosphatase [Acidobacteria bacterium]|nr:tyrosine-protein phosphatase [Acidobacteriota bacterium]